MEEIIICAWCKTNLKDTNKESLVQFDFYYCMLSTPKLFGEKSYYEELYFCCKDHLINFFSRLHRSHPHIPIDAFYKLVRGGWLIDQKKVLNYARKGTFIRRNKEIRK